MSRAASELTAVGYGSLGNPTCAYDLAGRRTNVGAFGGGSYAGIPCGGTFINTGDLRGRGILGGGRVLGDPGAYAPIQPLVRTAGCTRGHNQDVQKLANLIEQYQEQNPNVPIIYCRSEGP